MSTIVGPWSLWTIRDPPAGADNEADIFRLIKTLTDFAIDDWKRDRQMSTEEQEWLAGGGGPPSFSFAQDGAAAYGRVLSFELVQERAYGSNALVWWDKEETQPKMQGCFTMQAEGIVPTDEDNGQRRLFVKLAMKEAIQKAVKESGFKGSSLAGGMLWVKHEGYGIAKNNPQNPPKAYKAKFKPPSESEMLDAIDEPAPEPALEVPEQTATWPGGDFSEEPF